MPPQYPSALVPIFTTRHKRLLNHVLRGTYEELMDELYKIAEEDLDASQLPPGHPDKKNVDASMRLILNDRDTGKFEIPKLLHTVDEAYGPRLANCRTAQGDRYWLSQPKKVEIFIANLRRIHRAQLARDPSGKTVANQSPIEVGCSDVISTHIGAHSLKSDLTGSTKLWGFMLSCLKELKIKIHIVTLAILKVWTPEQINLGEILITVLTGSLVEDGGYNISQAGSKPQLMKPVNYDQEFEEIFGSSSGQSGRIREEYGKLSRSCLLTG
ncbi:hypothetical protein BGZ57DRAFT_819757 [Hyaloscypha finlandica]|nr:hypothetical protein BGZ57DRAFT_819757 [Hyaloscypha finlandica]